MFYYNNQFLENVCLAAKKISDHLRPAQNRKTTNHNVSLEYHPFTKRQYMTKTYVPFSTQFF